MMRKKFKFFILSMFFFFLPINPLSAELNSVAQLDKAQALIAHVKKSIGNAQRGLSKLNQNILNIEGLSSPIIRHFLNNVCSLDNANYLEIGCWKGSTLVSAAYKNEDHLNDIVAIDNWSILGGPKNEFLQNVNTYMNTDKLRFYETDCFSLNKASVFKKPVNIYFYDGEHYFSDQKSAFTYYNDVFDDVFIAIVDDWNWEAVQKGTFAAFEELKYEVLYEQPFFTPRNADTTSWWNGFYIAVIQKSK